ncbi:GTP-binding protein [Tulasnella sp. JGI-2019a]|nr:GTP-binding protein [Tulasnella sp. JGI-2019a]KAG9028910.1 GTP-binding protein [Tulasnella sp. JGI-2019a]
MGEVPNPPLEALEFWGGPNEEVTAFLGTVKRVAMMHDRHSDNEWLVSYTESCLRGDAMRWFDTMGPDAATMDWSSLRRLFLSRFNTRDLRSANPPAPAAAAIGRPISQEIPTAPLPATVAVHFDDIQAMWLHKILILGNSGVGKSCLLSRSLGHGWIPSTTPTIGIHYETVAMQILPASGRGATLSKTALWDVSGKECRSRLGPYCQGMGEIWIVYDITDRNSFQDVKQWFDLVMQHNPMAKARLYLIGNKRDLHNQRVVQRQQGCDLARELGIPRFYETSARTNEGVTEMWGMWLGIIRQYKV